MGVPPWPKRTSAALPLTLHHRHLLYLLSSFCFLVDANSGLPRKEETAGGGGGGGGRLKKTHFPALISPIPTPVRIALVSPPSPSWCTGHCAFVFSPTPCGTEWKGLESCLLWLAPGSKPNNMAAVMKVNTVCPQIDDFTKCMNFCEEKRLEDWKECLLISWEKFSDVNTDWRGARARFGNTRVHPTCICYKWPFADDLWLRFVLTKKPKTRGGPCDARHASSWGESLKTADVVTIFTAWILPSLGWNRKKKAIKDHVNETCGHGLLHWIDTSHAPIWLFSRLTWLFESTIKIIVQAKWHVLAERQKLVTVTPSLVASSPT